MGLRAEIRDNLLAALRAGEPVDPIVQATAPHIRLPHEATEGVKPVDHGRDLIPFFFVKYPTGVRGCETPGAALQSRCRAII